MTRRPSDPTDMRIPCPGGSRVFYRMALGEPGRRAKCPRGASKRVEAARHIVPSSN